MASDKVWGPSFSSMMIIWGCEAVEQTGLRKYHKGMARLAFFDI
jgi:hypothetical protein